MNLGVCPVRIGALQLSRLGGRDFKGRQIEVEADEVQLREDSHQPARQSGGSGVCSVTTKHSLELLAADPPPVPKVPVERHKRSPESVLLLVHLLRKA